MASAKARFYANQAKKGKITKAQAASYGVSEKNKPKTSKISSSSKSSPAPLRGAGPLLPGQTREATYAGPSLPGQTQAGYYNYDNNSVDYDTSKKSSSNNSNKGSSGSSNRKVASTALNGKSFADASLAITRPKTTSVSQGQASTTSPWRGALESVLSGVKNSSLFGPVIQGVNAMGFDLTDTLGIPKARASVGDYFDQQASLEREDKVKQGINDFLGNELFSTGNTPSSYNPVATNTQLPNTSNTPTNDQRNQNVNRPRPQQTQVTNPFIPQTSTQLSQVYQPRQEQSVDNSYTQPGNQGTVRRYLGNGSPMSTGAFSNGQGDYGYSGAFGGSTDGGDQNSTLNDLMMALGLKPQVAQAAEMPSMFNQNAYRPNNYAQSEMYQNTGGMTGPGNMLGYFQQPSQQTSNSQRQQAMGGSQQVGVPQQVAQPTNPMQDYYNKSIKGYGKQEKETEKAYKKALEEMLAGIKSQYDTSQTQGETSLNKAKQEDLLKQSGLFNFANQDPNSEQRMQYDARMNNDYAGQLTDFLAKLASSKSQDINSAKQSISSQKNSALQGIQSQRSSAQEQLAQLMSKLQQSSAPKASRSYAPKTTSTKISHNDIFNYVNDAASQGGTWQEIADQAAAQGIDTSTGSYLDQLLRNKFRG